ncbi:MAG: NAD kinase [Burkholderiaceae bacterium]
MPSRFRHAALVGKYLSGQLGQGPGGNLEEIANFLLRQGLEVSLEKQTAQSTGIVGHGALSPEELGRQCDLAVVVGGDGTMLGIARQLARHGTPLVGINQGRLGFITDIAAEHYAQALAPILAGEYEEERRTMLEGSVWRDGRVVFEAFALNDVVVSRGATSSMVELKVDIGSEFVANFRADGLIVGSPTGSTAYAMSAGGPILHPGVAAWVLVPIASHDLSNRTIVLPDTVEIGIEIVAGRDASVSFDMQAMTGLLHGDRVTVRRSSDQVRFLHPRGWSYYATLRRKLRWNAGGA